VPVREGQRGRYPKRPEGAIERGCREGYFDGYERPSRRCRLDEITPAAARRSESDWHLVRPENLLERTQKKEGARSAEK
jgi:hypothetical protein